MSSERTRLKRANSHMRHAVGRTLARLRTEVGNPITDAAILDLEFCLAYHDRAVPTAGPAPVFARHIYGAN